MHSRAGFFVAIEPLETKGRGGMELYAFAAVEAAVRKPAVSTRRRNRFSNATSVSSIHVFQPHIQPFRTPPDSRGRHEAERNTHRRRARC
jgi:hypothetical protein